MTAAASTRPNSSSPGSGRRDVASRAAARFRVETRELFVQRTRIGCWLAFTLIPIGSLLDYVSYPSLFYEILVARLLAAASIVGIYFALRIAPGRRKVFWLSAAWAIIPALTISWMIYLTEGGASPFYAGLNLVILGTCVLVPYTLSQAAVYCFVVYGIYALACLAHGELAATTAPFISNSIFIVMTSVICVTFCHFSYILRRRDFHSREKVERQNRELRELDEMKSRFFANVSHELRTPLALILAPVQELMRSPQTDPARSLRTIERSAQRLSRLIDDLLDLVRLDNASPVSMRRVSFDANARLRALGESAEPLARSRGLALELRLRDSNASVSGDPEQFDRAVLNLLSNAFKFTPRDGRVAIVCRREESTVAVDVTDTGIGMEEAEIPRVTERFAQIDDSGTRKYQGLGLGLAIAKGIVESHGGSLSIRSRLGEGTTVSLRFPIAADSPVESDPKVEVSEYAAKRFAELALAETFPEAPDASEGRVAQVLIADDEPELREFLRATIGQEWAATAVADGDAALEVARRDRPEVLVLDMMMPGRSGLDVCRALREIDAEGDTRILLLTARVEEELKLEALSAGADDFLFKPFSVAEVRARVGNLVRTASLQRALRSANDELRGTLQKLGETRSQLVQSEKMNALGALAAGILHEFKNPLNHALMAISVARAVSRTSRDEVAADLEDALSDAEGAVRRIDEIASEMRAFAHPEQFDDSQSFLLADAVASSLRFVGPELAGIRVHAEIDPELVVRCPRTHLVQLLVNLLSNAAAAVKQTKSAREPRIEISTRIDGDRARVCVRDNGIGVPPERLTRIFDPFYTTKPVGEGTGLGLTVSHAIAARWGSDLAVASEPDAWTEFRFDLPVDASTIARKASA